MNDNIEFALALLDDLISIAEKLTGLTETPKDDAVLAVIKKYRELIRPVFGIEAKTALPEEVVAEIENSVKAMGLYNA